MQAVIAMRGRRARLLPRGVGSLHMSGLGVVSPEPCTSVSAYLRYLLVCVRSERFSPLVEHALRTMHMPLEPGRRIPRLRLERGTASPWDWLAWRLLEPEGRRVWPDAGRARGAARLASPRAVVWSVRMQLFTTTSWVTPAGVIGAV